MTDAISKLRDERIALRARLEKIDAAIAEYDRWAASVQGLLGDAAPQVAAQGSADAVDASVAPSPKGSPIEEFEEAVRRVLGEAQSPMQRGPLLSALERLGIVIFSSNPANAMATRLSRMDDVVNIRGEGYWLQEKVGPEDTHGGDPDGGDVEGLV